MQITKTSLWSGITRTRDLPITQEQYAAWQQGMVIQRAMPQLSASEREWLISGLDEGEWQEMCDDNDEDE